MELFTARQNAGGVLFLDVYKRQVLSKKTISLFLLQYAVVQQKVELAIEKNVMSPILQSFVL